MKYSINTELSEKEIFLIGRIIALWGFLMHEIFVQTIITYDNSETQLPREMNNLQFTKVLELWHKRVVLKSDSKRQEVLQKQYERILHYYEFRNALVHGMWEWSAANPEVITSIRIKNKEIISTHLTVDDLEHLDEVTGEINYWVMYPGGSEDHAKAMAEHGAYFSRSFICQVNDEPKLNDLFPDRKKKT